MQKREASPQQLKQEQTQQEARSTIVVTDFYPSPNVTHLLHFTHTPLTTTHSTPRWQRCPTRPSPPPQTTTTTITPSITVTITSLTIAIIPLHPTQTPPTTAPPPAKMMKSPLNHYSSEPPPPTPLATTVENDANISL